MFYTADRETGTFIEAFATVTDARDAIRNYEADDRVNSIYESDFYDIVDEDHRSIG